MRTTLLGLAAVLAFGVTHANEMTFVASGPVTYITPGWNDFNGYLAHPVNLGDEMKFFYTFETTTPGWIPYPGRPYLIYEAIKSVRVEVAGNVLSFVPCGNCAHRILVEDDDPDGLGYWDTYQVTALPIEPQDGVSPSLMFQMSSFAVQPPVPALMSTQLPVVPPDPAAFQDGVISMSYGNGVDIVVQRVTSHRDATDRAPPRVSGLVADPNPVVVNSTMELQATVDDTAAGGSAILSADFSVDGGAYEPMTPGDGEFGGATETVTTSLQAFSEPGVHDVCVRATDAQGNTSRPVDDLGNACALVVAYDPSGGFVTGVGWINSEVGACQSDPVCAAAGGKADFGFVSRYRKGATIPGGSTEFQFSSGGFNFHSESYEWLVVNSNGTTAQYKGSGNVNDAVSPAGEAYRFMLWASDAGRTGTDTFRIKIWYVDAGVEVVVYDNGFNQLIGGGNIVVHSK